MPIDDLKTLRNELLMQRRAFAQTSEADACLHSLTGHLDRALSSQFSSVKSIALYWPIQEEIDLRDTLKSWASALPDRCLALPVTRKDRYLDFGNGAMGIYWFLTNTAFQSPTKRIPRSAA